MLLTEEIRKNAGYEIDEGRYLTETEKEFLTEAKKRASEKINDVLDILKKQERRARLHAEEYGSSEARSYATKWEKVVESTEKFVKDFAQTEKDLKKTKFNRNRKEFFKAKIERLKKSHKLLYAEAKELDRARNEAKKVAKKSIKFSYAAIVIAPLILGLGSAIFPPLAAFLAAVVASTVTAVLPSEHYRKKSDKMKSAARNRLVNSRDEDELFKSVTD